MVRFRRRIYGGRRGRSRSRSFPPGTLKRFRAAVRGGNYSSFSGRTGPGRSLNFSRKRMSRRAFKNSLWKSTQHLPHYRSQDTTSQNMATNVNNLVLTTYMHEAIPAAFWTTAGGLEPLDTGATTDPLFTGDITIRGGKLGISISNDNASDTIMAFIFLIKRPKNATGTWSDATTVGVGWDPTLVPEFKQSYGTIIHRANKVLLPLEVFQLEKKIPIQKIDRIEHDANNTYVWFVGVRNQFSTAVNCNMICYHNLSFTGDATVNSVPA